MYLCYMYHCSYVKTKTRKSKGGKIAYQGGEIAMELQWKDAPARGIDIVGQRQTFTIEQWKDYRALKA